MIRGIVTADLVPMVTIDVGNGSGDFESLNFAVDTGFDGDVTMPYDVIQRLALPYEGQAQVTLADEQQRQSNIYRGIVFWHGRQRNVMVIEMDGEPLLGMSLLQGSELTVSAQPGGPVRIEEITAGA